MKNNKKCRYFLVLGALFVGCTGNGQTVRYSDYGAVGDGKTDDFEAIIKAHNAANEAGRPVQADPGATYYIGGADKTAVIQTDTDWGDARFIIDDRDVENNRSSVFVVTSKLPPAKITTVKTLKKNQKKLDLSLAYGACIIATDEKTMLYIRYGANQNSGKPKTDLFVVDPQGYVDMRAPIIWDFDHITSLTAFPIDTGTLTIRGGHFTTIANHVESNAYYARNIAINRSNTVLDGLQHFITGESDRHGSPYNGFIFVADCANVTVRNCLVSGHKVFPKLGLDNNPTIIPMGTYDVSVNRAVNTTFRNCRQVNDIHDRTLWGIFASNYSKNITFDSVEFSRFDAHMGVCNATIRNSVLGYQGVNLIGSGTFLIENTKVCSGFFLNLRSDYGSTWEGEVIIRNCEFIPRNGAKTDVTLINGVNSGQHDFGYRCYMPWKVTIDELVIHDTNPVDGYEGPKIFNVFNDQHTGKGYKEKYPYIITEEVIIKNMTIKSGKPYIVSKNPYLFRNVEITEK